MDFCQKRRYAVTGAMVCKVEIPEMIKILACARCVVVILAMAAVAGCPKPEPDPVPAPTTRKAYTIAVSQCTRDDPWRAQMDADIQAAAREHAKLKVVFEDAQGDSRKQCKQVARFVEQGVDLIIICPNESQALTAPVAEAYEGGIPVIVVGRALIGDKYTCLISVDHAAIGRAAGEWLAARLAGKGKIVELKGAMDTAAEQELHRSFHDALNDPGFRIFEVPTQRNESKAREAMHSTLERYDEIDAVFAHTDRWAQEACQVAEDAGRRNGVVFVGVGALPDEGIEYVDSGILEATVENPTGGAKAIELARKILAGKTVEKKIVLGPRVFTAEDFPHRGGNTK